MDPHSSNVPLSNQSPEPLLVQDEQITHHDANALEVHDSMADFYQLQRSLLLTTLVLMGIIFSPCGIFAP